MADKHDEKDLKKKKKDKGAGKGAGRKLKEIYSELKKVEWPKFPVVVKSTGTVLAVVGIFLVVLLGFDLLLSAFVYNPLISGDIGLGSSSTLAVRIFDGFKDIFRLISGRLA